MQLKELWVSFWFVFETLDPSWLERITSVPKAKKHDGRQNMRVLFVNQGWSGMMKLYLVFVGIMKRNHYEILSKEKQISVFSIQYSELS